MLLVMKFFSNTIPLMLTAVIYMLLGETCVGAKPTADIYSTRNILLSRETVFIVEFSLKCNNNVKVSWAESHKEAKSGIYTLSFYDEAGYAAYRKAQRSGTENEAKPLFTVDIDHKGAGREGLYVQTEFIAVVAALLIWWSANNVKSKLQES
ncbi:Translocon-associated protein subunit delta [Acropora cervicornis]|uniref:Translocon-associated protein subunit delta n=1 Tax=Acropora cervicornis TaxID=6130 RepID=A0AAD9PXX3_ACRCE|nr:Translocon-associated protein subunit delta [Acropora cervicornis]